MLPPNHGWGSAHPRRGCHTQSKTSSRPRPGDPGNEGGSDQGQGLMSKCPVPWAAAPGGQQSPGVTMAEGDCRPVTKRGPPSAMGTVLTSRDGAQGVHAHYGSLRPGGETCEPSSVARGKQRPETVTQLAGSSARPEAQGKVPKGTERGLGRMRLACEKINKLQTP